MRDLLGVLSLLGGFGLLGFHTYEWLRWGVWTTYRLTMVLYVVGNDRMREWLLMPTDWVGLHDMLAALPLWGVCFILAGLAAMWPEENHRPQADA